MTRRLLTLLLVGLVAVLHVSAIASVSAQASEALAGEDELDCGHLVEADLGGQEHAEALLLAFPSDPYGLDDDDDGEPCETESDLGQLQRASCAAFLSEAEGGQEHAQELLDEAGPSVYDLDANGDGIACSADTIGGDEPIEPSPIPSDLSPDPVPEAAPDDCDVVVEDGRAYVYTDCEDGRVEVGFRPFEGFDAFAERAQNGFGAFDDAADTGTTTTVESAQAVSVTDSTGTTSRQPSATQSSRLVESEQRAQAKAQKRKAKKAKRAKQRQLERQRLRQQQ